MVLTDEIWAVLEPAARMGEGFTKDDLEKGIKGHQCFLFTKNKSAAVCIKIKNTLRIALGGGDMDDMKEIFVNIEDFAKSRHFNAIDILGREGWLKILPGFKKQCVLMRKEIK